MKEFRKLNNLNGQIIGNDHLEEGYFINPFDKNDSYFFVARRYTNGNYYIKVALGDNVDLHDESKFPQSNAIFIKNNYLGEWVNRGTEWHNYKYVEFGNNIQDKVKAITSLRKIICDILMSASI